MPVLVQNYLRAYRLRKTGLVRAAETILRTLGERQSELSVSLVGDRRMRRLNRRYRGKDRTTDVLAFAVREGPLAGVPQLGDVVISVPTALRQAREANRTLDQEMTVLLIHGILHLCGYDHERSRAEARRMQRRERSLLLALQPIRPMLMRKGEGRSDGMVAAT